jgi:hypothetical protein
MCPKKALFVWEKKTGFLTHVTYIDSLADLAGRTPRYFWESDEKVARAVEVYFSAVQTLHLV